jgi:uncharacterized protein DUF6894
VPRFYFHLLNDIDVPDDEGRECADLAAAEDYARCQARELAGAMIKEEGRVVLHHRIDVEDAQHRTVATVWFRDALQIVD